MSGLLMIPGPVEFEPVVKVISERACGWCQR